MRKSSKILAILLTVVMLLGIVSVISAAAETPVHPTLSVKGDGISTWSKGSGWTFEGANYGYHWSGITGDKAGAPSTEIGASSKSHAHFDTRNVMGSDGTSILNTYGAFWADKDEEINSANASDTYFDFQYDNVGAQAFGNKYTLINNDFMTIDFDLASDMFIDENGNLTDENTDTLAYNGAFATYMRANGNHWSTGITLLSCKLEVDANLGPVINVNGNKFPLQKTAGTWNHVTIILATDSRIDYTTAAGGEEVFTGYYKDHSAEAGFSIVKTYASNTMVYLYIDGVYCYSAKPVSTSVDTNPDYFDVHLYNTRWSGNGVDASWSHCVDNVVASYFATGYAGPMSERFNLDGTHPKSLGNLTDMIYNYGYQYSAPNKPAATLTPANGTPSYYYNLEAATARLAEGDTLKLEPGYSIKDYVATFPFLVKCDEGAFTIHEDCNFRTKRVEGGYEVLEITEDDRIPVTIYADYDTMMNDYENVLSADTFVVFGKKYGEPNVQLATGLVPGPDGTFSYNTHIGWKAYYFADGSVEPTEIPFSATAPVADEYLEIIANLRDDSTFYLVPQYEAKTVYFAAYDDAGEMLTDKNGGYLLWTDPLNFYDCLTDAFNAYGSGVTFKLLSDVRIDGKTSGFMLDAASAVVNVDLNGYTLIQNLDKSGSKPSVFGAKNGTINVYSSRPGARLFSSTGRNGSATGGWGGGVFGLSGTNNATINVGGVCGADGANLSIYAPALVGLSCNVGWKKAEGATPSSGTFNFIGAKYYRENTDQYGAIKADGHLTVNISGGAMLYGGNLISTDARYLPKLTMNVDGATFVSTNGELFYLLHKDSVVTFVNTNLIGISKASISQHGVYNPDKYDYSVEAGSQAQIDSNKGKIILGIGTKLTISQEELAKYPENWFIDTENGIVVAADDAVDYSYTSYTPAYIDAVVQADSYNTPIPHEFKRSVYTKILDKSTVQYATVNWFDADGVTPLGTSRVVVGELATPDFETPTKELNNGWYDLAFGGWLNLDGTEAELRITEAGTYDFKGDYTTPVINMKNDVLFNFELADKYIRHLYIPAFIEGVEGLEAVNVYDSSGQIYESKYVGTTTIDGKLYYVVTGYPSITDVSWMSVKVSLTVNGVETDLKQYSIKTDDYYTRVLARDGVTDEEKTLIVNTLRYVDAMQTLSGRNAGTFTDLIETYKSYLIDIESAEFNALIAADADRADMAELATVIKGATFYINNDFCPVVSIIKADAVDFDPSKTYFDYKTFANAAPGGGITFDFNDEGNDTHFFNKYFRLKAYYYTGDITIYVQVGEDVYTGVYNLGAYIEGIDANEGDSTFGRILYAYSLANFMYQTETNPLAPAQE